MLAYDRFATAIGKITVVMSDKGVCCRGLPLKKARLRMESAAA